MDIWGQVLICGRRAISHILFSSIPQLCLLEAICIPIPSNESEISLDIAKVPLLGANSSQSKTTVISCVHSMFTIFKNLDLYFYVTQLLFKINFKTNSEWLWLFLVDLTNNLKSFSLILLKVKSKFVVLWPIFLSDDLLDYKGEALNW